MVGPIHAILTPGEVHVLAARSTAKVGVEDAASIVSRSRRRSAALACRAAGTFSRQRMMIASSLGSMWIAATCEGGVGDVVTCWMQMSIAVLPANRRLP